MPVGIGKDFHAVAVLEAIPERQQRTINLRAGTFVPDIGMDFVREVNWRCAGG